MLGTCLGVDSLGELVRRGGQRLRFGFDRLLVVAFQRFLGFLHRRFDLRFFVRGNLVGLAAAGRAPTRQGLRRSTRQGHAPAWVRTET